MEIKVTMPTKIKLAKVRVSLPVRYDDENIAHDFPLRTGKRWDAVIDIDTGKIEGWPADAGEQSMYMRVCDEGRYELLGEDGKVLFHRECYVPHEVIPGEYGDYVELDIASDGTIRNWNVNQRELEDQLSEDSRWER